MSWLTDLWQKWKAWGDLWLGGWFDPQPIQHIEEK